MPGKLYLIPNNICEDSDTIPAYVAKIVSRLRVFLVEEEKSARRLLKKFNPDFPLKDCSFFLLNEHTDLKEFKQYFLKIVEKEVGLISEAGCPCVADPGSEAVFLAHEYKMEVIPLVGPSSIMLALMGSGLNGQNFAFNGYLPKEKEERLKKIKTLEKRSFDERQTQIFMETPYRNQNVLEDVFSVCSRQTLLSVAVDLTGPGQLIRTMSIESWKISNVALPKRPALFLLEKR